MAERLRPRIPEIADAVLERLHAMEREEPVRDVEYLESLSNAVRKGVEYGIEVLAVGEERAVEVPLAVILQARVAARQRVPLETILQRYLAAEKHFTAYSVEEAVRIDPSLVPVAMATQGTAFEHLVALATEEYQRETRARPSSHEARRVERARRLLTGELVDPSILEYELGGHHLGLVATSTEARSLIRGAANDLGCRCLILAPSSEELWAWIGRSSDPADSATVRNRLTSEGEPGFSIGMGEPKSDRNGWRLTHEQARAAVWVAEAKRAPVIEYKEAALLASIGRDTTLTTSLHERYLAPLATQRDGGQILRDTLRSYFQADRNSSCAAASLGVSRQTVAKRLQMVERCVGQSIGECADVLHAALRLEELKPMNSKT